MYTDPFNLSNWFKVLVILFALKKLSWFPFLKPKNSFKVSLRPTSCFYIVMHTIIAHFRLAAKIRITLTLQIIY